MFKKKPENKDKKLRELLAGTINISNIRAYPYLATRGPYISNLNYGIQSDSLLADFQSKINEIIFHLGLIHREVFYQKHRKYVDNTKSTTIESQIVECNTCNCLIYKKPENLGSPQILPIKSGEEDSKVVGHKLRSRYYCKICKQKTK